MIITENDRLRITGQDEVILSIVLFILNLFLDEKAFARTYLGMALKYFRDLGLPLDRWLFDRILETWDTKLAYDTPARTIPFPQDARDPAGGEIVIYKMRRREIWKSMCTAVGYKSDVAAPGVDQELDGDWRRSPIRRGDAGFNGNGPWTRTSRPTCKAE